MGGYFFARTHTAGVVLEPHFLTGFRTAINFSVSLGRETRRVIL
jgi:hypothetical protein